MSTSPPPPGLPSPRRRSGLKIKKAQARILRAVGYALFGVSVLILSFYASLPRERLRERLERELSQDQGLPAPGSGALGMGTGMDVQIGDLDLHLFPVGASVSEVTLKPRNTGGSVGTPPAGEKPKPKTVYLDRLRVKLPLFALLFGDRGGGVEADAFGGHIEADAMMTSDQVSGKIAVDSLSLARAQPLLTGLPLPMLGSITLHADFKAPLQKTPAGAPPATVRRNQQPQIEMGKATGTADITLKDGVLGDGKAKLVVPGDPFLSQGLTFPKLKLGEVTGSLVIDRGKATITDLHGKSPDAEIWIDGHIELREPYQLSEMRIYVRFKPSAALMQREPTMEILNNAMSLGKRPDGALGFALTGSLAAPRSRPAKEPPEGVTIRSGSLSKVGSGGTPASPAIQPRGPMPPSSNPPGANSLPPPPPPSSPSRASESLPPPPPVPQSPPPASPSIPDPPPPPPSTVIAPQPQPPTPQPSPVTPPTSTESSPASHQPGVAPQPGSAPDPQPDPPSNFPTNQRGY